MSALCAKLEALGVARITPADEPEIYAELYRVARRLREAERAVVGLIPANAEVAVASLALQLAFALADACVADVAVIDANTLRPAFAALCEDDSLEQPTDELVAVQVAERVWVATAHRWHAGGLDLALLERTISAFRRRYVHVLVDLSGFAAMGEQWLASDLVDGVLLVARVGKTKERELLERSSELPAACNLGVLLMG